MKKMFAAVLVAFLMSMGLVASAITPVQARTADLNAPASVEALASSPAPARAAECPYTGCIRTSTNATAPRAKTRNSFFLVRVTVRAGNAVPRGMVRISLRGQGAFRIKTVPYRGSTTSYRFKLPRPAGVYRGNVTFLPTPTSAFRRSGDTFRIRATR